MTPQDTIARNLAAVEAHFHISFTLTREGYLPFSVGQKVEMRLVHIFEMRDGKISQEIAFEMPHAVE